MNEKNYSNWRIKKFSLQIRLGEFFQTDIEYISFKIRKEVKSSIIFFFQFRILHRYRCQKLKFIAEEYFINFDFFFTLKKSR